MRDILTQNLHSVDEIPVDVIADLTDIIARIVRFNARYYEIVAVQRVPSVPAHDNVGRCQHICSASPQHDVISCWPAVEDAIRNSDHRISGNCKRQPS